MPFWWKSKIQNEIERKNTKRNECYIKKPAQPEAAGCRRSETQHKKPSTGTAAKKVPMKNPSGL
jgi:hypothetical protein